MPTKHGDDKVLQDIEAEDKLAKALDGLIVVQV
jgi:hypothetical protein